MTDVSPIVFVVDDDLSVRKALGRLLKSAGLHAKVFASAQEFLTQNLAEAPSCLVLDVSMPEMTGLELQRRPGRQKPRPAPSCSSPATAIFP